jgi:hypothetical protein
VTGDCAGVRSPILKVQAKLKSSGLASSLIEQGGRAGRVSANTGRPALANLYSGRRELDEGLDHPCRGRTPLVRVPQCFPRLVRLPVIALVEQRDPAEVGGGARPAIADDRIGRALWLVPGVAAGRSRRMGPRATGDVRIGRKGGRVLTRHGMRLAYDLLPG